MPHVWHMPSVTRFFFLLGENAASTCADGTLTRSQDIDVWFAFIPSEKICIVVGNFLALQLQLPKFLKSTK